MDLKFQKREKQASKGKGKGKNKEKKTKRTTVQQNPTTKESTSRNVTPGQLAKLLQERQNHIERFRKEQIKQLLGLNTSTNI